MRVFVGELSKIKRDSDGTDDASCSTLTSHFYALIVEFNATSLGSIQPMNQVRHYEEPQQKEIMAA